jgi:hypothetical protein
MNNFISKTDAFPELPLGEWKDTKNTLHLYLQIVGKIRLTTHPPINHWWNVPFYVTPFGLTTATIPYGFGSFEIEFDLINHKLKMRTSKGEDREFNLHDGLTVAEFYKQVFANLESLGIEVEIKGIPYEAPTQTPFAECVEFKSYDKEYIEKFQRILTSVNDIFTEFRGRFIGKSTPVHLFWHSFDLAVTRFSGRKAPEKPDAGIVERRAYSHEVISFGFWAGDDNVPAPAFYSYTAPEPENLPNKPLKPDSAGWNTDNGAMAILMYDDVRNSEDPRKEILEFLESSYLAGAKSADWDVEKFELK